VPVVNKYNLLIKPKANIETYRIQLVLAKVSKTSGNFGV
jgi:hypothetical protein